MLKVIVLCPCIFLKKPPSGSHDPIGNDREIVFLIYFDIVAIDSYLNMLTSTLVIT